MPSLIVIRIVPEVATAGDAFTGYLTTPLGDLQITAFDLSFNSAVGGTSIGTATYVAPTTWVPQAGHPDRSDFAPAYPAGLALGIVQQVHVVPGLPPYFQLDASSSRTRRRSPPSAPRHRLSAPRRRHAGLACSR